MRKYSKPTESLASPVTGDSPAVLEQETASSIEVSESSGFREWPNLTTVDTAAAKRLTLNDLTFFMNQVNRFLDDLPSLLVSLNCAFESKDVQLLSEIAHKLAGRASLFGALHLSSEARVLQQLADSNSSDIENQYQAVVEHLVSVEDELTQLLDKY